MSDKTLSFEEALARLDSIVRQLEKGDAPLDQALALFEEGTSLIGSCTKMLDEAEQKVVRLKKGSDGEPVELPFDSED
ncbi:MAG TPA: exodeoxyribonuclease VII small subunit [Clostridiales bacterium]|jgi:exodeoxyribonuclease VII small subunit|nr:exodeoxyribonuclease VII small subunit [Clostridiales bacterium]